MPVRTGVPPFDATPDRAACSRAMAGFMRAGAGPVAC
jgi:hypothetical protein